MNTTTNTEQGKITPQSVVCDLEKVDYPLTLSQGIRVLYGIHGRKGAIMAKFNISNPSYDTLLRITYDWVIEGKANSVYGLSDGTHSRVTSVAELVKRLVNRELVEVFGRGRGNCRTYIPSQRAIELLSGVVAVIRVGA